MQESRQRNPQPSHPDAKNWGTKRGKGNPPAQRKQSATRRQNEEENRQNCLGEHLLEQVQQLNVGGQHELGQEEKTTRQHKKKKQKIRTTHHLLSSVGPPKPVVLKGTVVGTMHPHPEPQNETRQRTYRAEA